MRHHRDGDTYLSHLRSEHHRLEVLTQSVIDRFYHARDTSWQRLDRPDIAARLAALKDELQTHLQREGQGGCVDEAVLRQPSLSHAARRLSKASETLLSSLAEATQAVEVASRAAAEHAFRGFADALRAHERQEEQLVAKGFGTFSFSD